MPKAFWFLAGFMSALALGVLLVILPMVGTGADALPAPVHGQPGPGAQAHPQPTPAGNLTGMRWVRRGGIEPPFEACSQLEVDAAWQLRYGPCDEGPRLAYLTESELQFYQAKVLALQPFDYEGRPSGALPDRNVTLVFAGTGSRPASPREQADLAIWAERVYARVMGEERRANLLAHARLDLMSRLRVGIQAIEVISMEPVRWPDACLGLRQEGMACARVTTDGYRMVLSVDGQAFEYRTDIHGQVRAVTGNDPRLTLPPLAP